MFHLQILTVNVNEPYKHHALAVIPRGRGEYAILTANSRILLYNIYLLGYLSWQRFTSLDRGLLTTSVQLENTSQPKISSFAPESIPTQNLKWCCFKVLLFNRFGKIKNQEIFFSTGRKIPPQVSEYQIYPFNNICCRIPRGMKWIRSTGVLMRRLEFFRMMKQ